MPCHLTNQQACLFACAEHFCLLEYLQKQHVVNQPKEHQDEEGNRDCHRLFGADGAGYMQERVG